MGVRAEHWKGCEIMKKFWIFIFCSILFISPSYAQRKNDSNMVKVENYFQTPLKAIGLIDYPPFSRYIPTVNDSLESSMVMESAFLKPINDFLGKQGITVVPENLSNSHKDLKLLILDVRSGKYNLFIGAYSNTQVYNGLQMIFPASIANPIHLITTPESSSKIKSIEDLKGLRGVVSKTEYFNDFVMRKFKEFGVTFVDTPYEGYEKIIRGEADYMLGGMYYNRMMASHYGLESFLSYSQKPLFKIPVFIAISKMTPRLSQYMEAIQAEFAKPEFANAVKQEILRIVAQERRRYEGVVPPSFVKHEIIEEPSDFINVEDDDTLMDSVGHIVEQKVKEKTVEEVLEGI